MIHLFISPHPDDVVWSCGGRIAQLINAGEEVLVVTIFDGDCFVDMHNESWRKIASPRLRRLENQSALATLGSSHISKGLVDAALRSNKKGFLYPTPEYLFGQPHPADHKLILSIAEELNELVYNKHINAPLGLGNHVDHFLVHQAVLQTRPKSIEWYEDFPYHFTPPKGTLLVPNLHQVDIEHWRTASLRYRSQIRIFFKNANSFDIALRKHAMDRGEEAGWSYAERTWVDITLST